MRSVVTPAFIDKHSGARPAAVAMAPGVARLGDVRPTLFVGVHLFLRVNPSRVIVRQSVLNAAVVGSVARNSTRVASRRAANRRSTAPARSPQRAPPKLRLLPLGDGP